jgi:hypothetical protein
MNCPQCNANAMTEGCDHAVSLVDDVPVEAVLDLAEDLFTREAAPLCTTLHDDDRASLQPAAQ